MYTPNYAVRNQYYHTATIEMCDAKDLEKVRLKNEKKYNKVYKRSVSTFISRSPSLKREIP